MKLMRQALQVPSICTAGEGRPDITVTELKSQVKLQDSGVFVLLLLALFLVFCDFKAKAMGRQTGRVEVGEAGKPIWDMRSSAPQDPC